jgi:guanine deaminase
VSCSEKLMRSAAEIAKHHGTYIQTHLAENTEEIEKVRNLFRQAQDYTTCTHNSASSDRVQSSDTAST